MKKDANQTLHNPCFSGTVCLGVRSYLCFNGHTYQVPRARLQVEHSVYILPSTLPAHWPVGGYTGKGREVGTLVIYQVSLARVVSLALSYSKAWAFLLSIG